MIFFSFLFAYFLSTFYKINFWKKISWTLSECHTIWVQIRTRVLSFLNWVQTYQQTPKESLFMYQNFRILILTEKNVSYPILRLNTANVLPCHRRYAPKSSLLNIARSATTGDAHMSHRFSQWNHGANNVLIMDWDICIFVLLLNCVYFVQGKNHLAEFVLVLVYM